ncbi:hypothetical protein OG357_13720 [Streptomyces sp. NBC_01255]|uniref:hypothetical protein n=1 Tax=Streptomyces sp. NBC_01255 TaxID=2903798 RepID=UPI002E31DFD4|nr:hypothetical protein [Streptomyces sp. NBC_01255]
MRAGRAMTGAALVAAAAALVAGCTGPGSGAGGSDGKGVGGVATDSTPKEPLARLSVPTAYDAAKGWDETLAWVPGSVWTVPVAVVPRQEAVALMRVSSDGYTLRVRAGATGELRWTSVPWRPPTPVEGAQGDPESGEAAEIPDVTGVEQDGRGYVVAYAHGMRGKDALHEGAEVVRLAVYAADASGSSVKPLREIDVPVSADPGEVRVRADGGRLLVAWGEEGMYPQLSHTVDVVTGAVTPYKEPDKLLRQCEDGVGGCSGNRVVAASADGPLVAAGSGGFGVPGRWFSDDVRPDGVAAKAGFLGNWNGEVYGVGAGRLLAQWDTVGEAGADALPVWSVHDVRTGRLQARMACGYEETRGVGSSDAERDYSVITSPSGRYLAAGPVVFDLERKKGICLEGDGDRKTIVLASLRDDGTAYGQVQEDSPGGEPVVAQLDLAAADGAPKVLGMGVETPFHTDVSGSGLFVTRDDDENVRISLRGER